MTFEERVEKATAVLFECENTSRQHAAEEAIRAAFSDVYGEKPTAWIAPRHPEHDARLMVARSIGASIDETNHMVRADLAIEAFRKAAG